jgi:hypothetical protein
MVKPCQFDVGGGESASANPLIVTGENPGVKFTFQILSGGD